MSLAFMENFEDRLEQPVEIHDREIKDVVDQITAELTDAVNPADRSGFSTLLFVVQDSVDIGFFQMLLADALSMQSEIC